MKNKPARKPARKPIRKPANKPAKKLTRKELGEYKKLILKRKEDIVDGIKHISDNTLRQSPKDAAGDISGYTYHMADVATDTYDREFSLSLASSEREELYELDDAIKKIEDGCFGICEGCKTMIAKSRLKALPRARMCVKCQEQLESK